MAALMTTRIPIVAAAIQPGIPAAASNELSTRKRHHLRSSLGQEATDPPGSACTGQ